MTRPVAIIDFETTGLSPLQGDRATEIDLRRFVLSAEIDDPGVLRLRLLIDPRGSARPEEILESLGLHDLLSLGAVLIRSDVELAP